MEKILPFIIAGVFLATGCSSPKVNTHETMNNNLVSRENMLKSEKITGMSIEECKASCPECLFARKFASTDGNYELWKVNTQIPRDMKNPTGPKREVYLHVVNGRIEKVAESRLKRFYPLSHYIFRGTTQP